MLSYILSAFSSKRDDTLNLDLSELPENGCGDSSYAVQVRAQLNLKGVPNTFVILEDGTVGVEASVGSSKWYCIPDRDRVLASHQLRRKIKFKGDGEAWEKCYE